MVPPNVKTVRDFVAWCKATPSRTNFFAAPAGSSQHFTGVLFAKAAGINLQLVDYKGGAPSIVDTMGGQVSSTMTALSEVTPYLNDSRLRHPRDFRTAALGGGSQAATFVESGYKDVVIQSWSGFLAPLKTPPELVAAAIAR